MSSIITTCATVLMLTATPGGGQVLVPNLVCQTVQAAPGEVLDSLGNSCEHPVTMIKAGHRSTLCPSR